MSAELAIAAGTNASLGTKTAAADANGPAQAKLAELLARLTTAKAAFLDAAVTSRASAADYTPARAALLDRLDTTVSSRLAAASYTAPDNTSIGTTLTQVGVLHNTRIPGVVQPQTGDAYARLGAPVGASHSADVAAVKAQAVVIEGYVDALETRIPGTVQPQTGDSYARLGAPVGASISADIATLDGKVMRRSMTDKAPDIFVLAAASGPAGGNGGYGSWGNIGSVGSDVDIYAVGFSTDSGAARVIRVQLGWGSAAKATFFAALPVGDWTAMLGVATLPMLIHLPEPLRLPSGTTLQMRVWNYGNAVDKGGAIIYYQ